MKNPKFFLLDEASDFLLYFDFSVDFGNQNIYTIYKLSCFWRVKV
jgi:hypothetical protein